VRDVVTAKNQFEPWNTASGRARMARLSPNSPGYKRLAEIYDSIQAGTFEDPTGGASFFLNPAVVRQRRGGSLPPWAEGRQPAASIGQHQFYTDPDAQEAAPTASPQAAPGAPVQVAQNTPPMGVSEPITDVGGSALSPELAQVLSSPWLEKSPLGKAIAEKLVTNKLMTPLEKRKLLAEIKKLERPDLTDDLEEVTRIQAEDAAAGKPRRSTEEIMVGLKAAGRQQISIDQRAETSFEKRLGEKMADEAMETWQAADKGLATMQQAQLLDKLLQDTQGGALAPAQATIGGYMQAFGMDPKALGIDPNLPTNAQTADALANRMTIGMIGPGGFPANNFSETDRKFIRDIFPKLGDTPGAQKLKAKVLYRIAELQYERGNSWADADAAGTSFRDWQRTYRKELRSRDGKNQPSVFDDVIKEYEALKVPAAGGATTAPVGMDAILEEKKRRGLVQ
jgi:hypothetical protein